MIPPPNFTKSSTNFTSHDRICAKNSPNFTKTPQISQQSAQISQKASQISKKATPFSQKLLFLHIYYPTTPRVRGGV